MTDKQKCLQPPPLSLYIHIPWCVRKCPYCDFNSHEAGDIPEQAYIHALIEDLDQDLIQVQNRELQSIFFGGGTPSLFSAQSIETILSEVERRIPFAPTIEITLEANPGTVEQSKFQGYRSAGVNRLSIGIQSFNDKHLKSLGRIHSGKEAIKAIHSAKQSGFENFNLDLMHGLPEQTQDQALTDLQQAVDLGPSHLSWYQLTIEPNTVFFNRPPVLPVDDELSDIQEAGEERLANYGYKQYEVSAYSHNHQRCAHNVNYWQFGDYIGIGAGAHGKITRLDDQTIQRRWKTRTPKDYLNTKDFLAGSKLIETSDRALEFLMNALRLNDGFQDALFEARTGLDLNSIDAQITPLIDKGLLLKQANTTVTTALGRRFLDSILCEFNHDH